MFFISLKYVCHFRLQVADTGEYTCAPQGPGLQNKTVFLEVNQVVQRYFSTLSLLLAVSTPIVSIIIFIEVNKM